MRIFLLFLLTLFSAGAFAALNKWVDKHGKVHYSDGPPPPNAKAEKIRSAPPAANEPQAGSAPAAPKTLAEREAELKKAEQARKKAAEKASQEQARSENKKTNCDLAQRNLRVLQEGGRLTDVDANGERYFLSDEQRQERITKEQQDVSIWCQ